MTRTAEATTRPGEAKFVPRFEVPRGRGSEPGWSSGSTVSAPQSAGLRLFTPCFEQITYEQKFPPDLEKERFSTAVRRLPYSKRGRFGHRLFFQTGLIRAPVALDPCLASSGESVRGGMIAKLYSDRQAFPTS